MAHLLHDSEEFLNSEGRMQMLYKDTASQLDSTNPKLSNPTHKIGAREEDWEVGKGKLNLRDTVEEHKLEEEEEDSKNKETKPSHSFHQRKASPEYLFQV